MEEYERFANKLSEKSGIPITVEQVIVWREGHCSSLSNQQQIESIQKVDQAIEMIIPNRLDREYLIKGNKLLIQIMAELDLVEEQNVR